MKLSEWAKEQHLSYMQAYRQYRGDGIKNAHQTKSGSIYVYGEKEDGSIGAKMNPPIPQNQTDASLKLPGNGTPVLVSEVEGGFSTVNNRTKVRKNSIHSEEETLENRFPNINKGIIPFTTVNTKSSSSYGTKSSINIKQAVVLCQKAYYNFATFRNTIDLMTEFSVNNIYFSGGTKKSRDFFISYFDKIGLWQLQDMFFREYFRSGNVFIWPYHVMLDLKDVTNIKNVMDNMDQSMSKDTKIPVRYILLNPADIQAEAASSFISAIFEKVLSPYELQKLKNPQTDIDKQIKKNLSPEERKMIDRKGTSGISIRLDPDRLTAIFYKKQSYEPFAVPMGFPVLDSIELKSELMKMDRATSRIMHQAVLLITMGAEPDKGGVNQANILAMQQLFTNQSVGRVIAADYTTKGTWLIPPIAEILDPKKYEVVERDIKEGLNNILLDSGEKFANQSIKAQVFFERLKQGREKFLNEFLVPEMKKISEKLGFRKIPKPEYEDLDFKDPVQEKRIYTRLHELGTLTAKEAIEAVKTGRLPTPEESEENQREYKKLKDEELYEPIIGGGKKEEGAKENGRPGGTSQTPQNNTRIQEAIGEDISKYSFTKIKDNLLEADRLFKAVKKEYLGRKKPNPDQEEVVDNVSKIIVANEKVEDWFSSITKYLKTPIDTNLERIAEIQEIAYEYELDDYSASILYISKLDE